MTDLITLRGLVMSRYRNMSAFAREMGWSRQKTMRIVDRKQVPKECEIIKLVEKLDVSAEVAFQIFFPTMFTLCIKNKEEERTDKDKCQN